MHRSKRNRARDFDYGSRHKSTFRPFLSNRIESRRKDDIHGASCRIRFYKYPRSKKRAGTTRFFLSSSPYISLLSQESAFPEFLFPSLDRPFPSSFFLYFFNSATRSFHESRSPRERIRPGLVKTPREDVRRNSRSIHDKISRGEEYKSGPHVRPLYLSVRQINIILLSRSQDLDHVHDHARGQDYSRPIQLSARVSVLAKAAEADLETDPPVTVNVTCVLT